MKISIITDECTVIDEIDLEGFAPEFWKKPVAMAVIIDDLKYAFERGEQMEKKEAEEREAYRKERLSRDPFEEVE